VKPKTGPKDCSSCSRNTTRYTGLSRPSSTVLHNHFRFQVRIFPLCVVFDFHISANESEIVYAPPVAHVGLSHAPSSVSLAPSSTSWGWASLLSSGDQARAGSIKNLLALSCRATRRGSA
jgi:hypothetical protein